MKAFLIDPLLDDRLAEVERRFEGVEEALSSPEVLADPTRIRELSQERSWLEPIVICGNDLRAALQECEGAVELIGTSEDPEMAALAEEEARFLQGRIEILIGKAKELLIPPDPLGDRPAVIEIRAGTGGDEAGLFAADLMRMYRLYAEHAGWAIELVDVSEGIPGAVKEVVFTVRGKGVYGRLRRESGVHRVQRVPATESQGRIHTSAATVAVLPEAEDVDVDIDPNELRIDTFRSSGPGGQSVNTTDSAIRITHIPTSLVVSCQDEKSQHKNKAKALKVLRSRLLDLKIAESEAERARDRKTQIGTGDRSAKIRTYNFPQNRVTDHRIGLTLYRLSEILDGDLEEVITALRLAEQEERMEDHEA